jgi:hypothetical protein
VMVVPNKYFMKGFQCAERLQKSGARRVQNKSGQRLLSD